MRKEQVSAKFVDTLLKIPLKDGGEQWVLLHIEVQGRGGEDLSRRMMRLLNYKIWLEALT